MDHTQAIQHKATEKYLLNELDPELRDQFEEHLFDCQDCAMDLRAAAMFVEQSKVILAEQSQPLVAAQPAAIGKSISQGWVSWFRPAFAVPVFALLLAILIYQNFVSYPRMMQAINQPQAIPWASVNVSTRGTSTTTVKAHSGQGFDLLVSIPQDPSYSSYSLGLYSPAGKLQWSLTIPANSQDDTRSIHVPGAGLEQGTYKLAVTGINSSGQSSSLGSYPVELQIQN